MIIASTRNEFFSSFLIQARVVAYDSLRPTVRSSATVQINVIRNANGPEFLATDYFTSISENTAVGATIFNITAVDADVAVCSLIFNVHYN